MGLKRLNEQVNDFERRQPVVTAAVIGVLVFLLTLMAWGSWTAAVALGAFVAVVRLLVRPRVVARRSLR